MIARTAPVAWHGDLTLKADAVRRMREHRAADRIAQGLYLRSAPDYPGGYRGCAIGCLTADVLIARGELDLTAAFRNDDSTLYRPMQGSWHAAAESVFGIRADVSVLLDFVFESLSPVDCGTYAVDVTCAIPVGADLSNVIAEFEYALLTDPTMGAVRAVEDGSVEHAAVVAVAALVRRSLSGDEPGHDEYLAAYHDACDCMANLTNSDHYYGSRWAAVAAATAAAAGRCGVDLGWGESGRAPTAIVLARVNRALSTIDHTASNDSAWHGFVAWWWSRRLIHLLTVAPVPTLVRT